MVEFTEAQLVIQKGDTDSDVEVTFVFQFSDDEIEAIKSNEDATVWSEVSFIGDDSPWPSESIITEVQQILFLSPAEPDFDAKLLSEPNKIIREYRMRNADLNEDDGWFNKEDEIFAEIAISWQRVNDGFIATFRGKGTTNTVESYF